jgi:hypothetical protein
MAEPLPGFTISFVFNRYKPPNALWQYAVNFYICSPSKRPSVKKRVALLYKPDPKL